MAKVSIIVPIYNVGKYLERCLISLVNQTFSDIEIILIDDGSTDNSYKIAKSFADKDNRIKLFHQHNSGASSARNLGISKITSEYTMFLDSDDYYETNCVEVAYGYITKDCSDVAIFGSIHLNEDGDVIKKIEYSEHKIIKMQDNPDVLLSIENCTWDKIYKTDLIKKHRIQYVNDLYYQDLAFTFECLSYCNHLSIINKTLVNYTVDREGNETNSVNNKMYDILKISDYLLQMNELTKYRNEINAIIVINIIDRIKFIIKCKDKEFAKKYIINCYDYMHERFGAIKHLKYNIKKAKTDFIYYDINILRLYILLKKGYLI